MAAPKPGPSKRIAPTSAPPNLRILRRIATKVRGEFYGVVGRRPRTVSLTGLQPGLISKLSQKNLAAIEIIIEDLERSVIYHQLMDIYLHEKTMPTAYQLFIKLFGKIPPHMDLGEFRNYLFKNGFMWKQIECKSVVIEDPKVVFERYSYLKNISRYRRQERIIYFIDEVAFDSKGNILSMKESMARQAEPQIRLIYAVTNEGVQVKQFVNEFSAESFLKWIEESLLNVLPKPSVIVLNNYKHHCEEILALPNENSLKKEMVEWLEYFNVPHDPEIPKALLYELIIKYTDVSKKMYIVDNMLRMHEHEVLRIPDCIIKLTPATYYFDILRKNMLKLLTEHVDPDSITTTVLNIMETVNEDHVGQYSEVIVDEEEAVLMKDRAVDSMLDDLENNVDFASEDDSGMDSELPSDVSDSDE